MSEPEFGICKFCGEYFEDLKWRKHIFEGCDQNPNIIKSKSGNTTMMATPKRKKRPNHLKVSKYCSRITLVGYFSTLL